MLFLFYLNKRRRRKNRRRKIKIKNRQVMKKNQGECVREGVAAVL